MKKKKLIIYSGISGCGKTTVAKARVTTNPSRIARLERDEYRRTIFGMTDKCVLSKEKEAIVAERQLSDVKEFFRIGVEEIIISDTNVTQERIDYWKDVAKELNITFEHVVFDVSLATALERNANRELEEQVPDSVIKRQHSRFLRTFGKYERRPLVMSSEKELAIIADLDGTIQLMNGRSPYDSMRCDTDMPNASVIIAIKAMLVAYPNVKFIAVSGREDKAFNKTYDALCSYGIEPHALFMRDTGDSRSDVAVKGEIYKDFIEPAYNVLFVYDDRASVVKMWRVLGLHCFQVAEGDF